MNNQEVGEHDSSSALCKFSDGEGSQVHFNVQSIASTYMFQINCSNAFRHHEHGMA